MPCARCERAVDPLRAPRVAHRGGRFRYYCSVECHARRAETTVTSTSEVVAAREPLDESNDRSDGPQADASANEGDPANGDSGTTISAMGAISATSDARALPRELTLANLVEFDGEPSFEQALQMLGVASAPMRRSEPAPEALEARTRPAAPIVEAPQDPRPALVATAALVVASAATRVEGTPSTLLAALAAFASLGVAARELWSLRAIGPWWLWAGPFAGALVALARALVRERPATSLALVTFAAATLPVAGYFARGARDRARRALEAQSAVLPRTARVLRADGELRTIEASALKAGEEFVVEAGERVAADGVVRASSGAVIDEVTGGRPLTEGRAVLAGALVRRGSLRVLATRAGDDVALARVRMMFSEEPSPAAPGDEGLLSGARLARVIGGGAALTVLALWALAQPKDPLATAALVLGALPPGLALPLAHVPFAHALATAIARGRVYRDRASLELAARVRTLVLCVRATLTRGVFELAEVVSLGSLSEKALLATAAGLELAADEQHPFAQALHSAARARGVRPETVRRPVAVPGKGVLGATSQGAPIVLGSRALLIAENVAVSPGEELARSIEAQGRHALFLAIDGRLEGVFGLEDPPREEARSAVQSLMDHGVDVALVGGESAGTLEALGLAVDIAHVRAEVPPDERAAAVRAIAEVSGRVAVAGRPAIDDLALGAADVSIAIEAAGGAGAETSVALTGDDLQEVSRAILDARAALVSARRATALSLSTTLLSALVAMFAPSPKIAAPVSLAVAALGAMAAARAARSSSMTRVER